MGGTRGKEGSGAWSGGARGGVGAGLRRLWAVAPGAEYCGRRRRGWPSEAAAAAVTGERRGRLGSVGARAGSGGAAEVSGLGGRPGRLPLPRIVASCSLGDWRLRASAEDPTPAQSAGPAEVRCVPSPRHRTGFLLQTTPQPLLPHTGMASCGAFLPRDPIPCPSRPAGPLPTQLPAAQRQRQRPPRLHPALRCHLPQVPTSRYPPRSPPEGSPSLARGTLRIR